ncbi:MAG TPA: hypothetical protein VIJ70_10470 [Gaiellaceae bacterium]
MGATLVGAAAAGVLLWVAAQIGRGSNGGYWAAYGIVAGAGLVFALTQLRGRNGHPPGMFLFGFLPVLIVAGWVLLGLQPHGNWFRHHVLSWSGDIGIRDVVLSVGTWIGVLAFGIGYTFGATLEPMRRRRAEIGPATAPAAPVAVDRLPADRVPAERAPADEPMTAERHEVGGETVVTPEQTVR